MLWLLHRSGLLKVLLIDLHQRNSERPPLAKCLKVKFVRTLPVRASGTEAIILSHKTSAGSGEISVNVSHRKSGQFPCREWALSR
jgi:hypothetical protein